MAAAKKCDRCNKLYEGYNLANSAKKFNGIQTLNIDLQGRYRDHKVMDLCPDCSNSFMEWLNAFEENEKED